MCVESFNDVQESCFAKNAPQSNLVVFNDENVHILVAKLSTNISAYKCISLFCNTFLASGKAVLVCIANGSVVSVWVECVQC